MELMDALKNRYSVRKFSSSVPSKQQIEAVLEAGRLAPTAKNFQPQRLFVVTGEEGLAAIDTATRCRYGAPVCIIVGYDTQEALNHKAFNEDEAWSFGDLDATSVLVHMLLEATEQGMGTCWLGAFEACKLHEAFDIPKTVAIRAIIDLGFPAEDCEPGPNHTSYRPAEETITWL